METIDTSTAGLLRQFIERVERLEEEKTGLAQDIREIFGEAKSQGFEIKTIHQVLRLRKMNTDERSEQEHLLDVYMHALGMEEQPKEALEEAA